MSQIRLTKAFWHEHKRFYLVASGRVGWIYVLYLYFGKSSKESQQIVTDTHKDNQVASIDSSGVQMWVVRDSATNLQTIPFDPICGYIRS